MTMARIRSCMLPEGRRNHLQRCGRFRRHVPEEKAKSSGETGVPEAWRRGRSSPPGRPAARWWPGSCRQARPPRPDPRLEALVLVRRVLNPGLAERGEPVSQFLTSHPQQRPQQRQSLPASCRAGVPARLSGLVVRDSRISTVSAWSSRVWAVSSAAAPWVRHHPAIRP